MTGRRKSPRPRSRTAPRATHAEPQVDWTERAVADLEAIADHIAQDRPGATERWATKILVAAAHAATMPLGGRRVPEVGRDDVREVLLRTYRIVYLVTSRGIAVLTVFEGHRRFPPDVDVPGEG